MFSFLIILFISPLILLFLFTVPQFIWSYFQKPKIHADVNKLYEKNPEISFVTSTQPPFKGGQVQTEILVKNFRNAKYYKSEWDREVNWENKKFKLEELENLDIFVDHYAMLQSHAILIFNFLPHLASPYKGEEQDIRKLCVSFQPKKKDPEHFKAYKTMYQNYECGYVLSGPEDLLHLRYVVWYKNNTSALKNLNIYKTNFTKIETQAIFMSLANGVNLYSKKAYFYNFIYRNCLTEVLRHLKVTERFDYSNLELLYLENLLKKNAIII